MRVFPLCENLAEAPDRCQHPLLLETWPLHAHDEVVDAETLLPARDLLLHRDLVADDEAVACHLLEAHRRGGTFHAPGGVGIVLVFERGAAFVHRRGMLRTDIA